MLSIYETTVYRNVK